MFLDKNLLREDSLNGMMMDEFSYNVKESGCKRLALSANRLKSLDSRLSSGFEFLENLCLDNNQLEGLNEDLLANCKNLRQLNLVNAFHPDAKFSLSFLPSISGNLQELSLTMPDGSPVDFSVFGQMNKLKTLELHGTSSQDLNRQPQKLNKEQLSQISSKLKKLNLSHFDLSNIELEIFQAFKKLEALTLSFCHIVCIHPNAFKDHSASLEHLDLSGNQISHLTDSMFVDLPLLTWLDLRFNKISDLSSGCFRGLSKLRDLYLSGNQIQDLPPGVFDGLSGLKRLNLSWNKLTRVNRDLFNDTKKIYGLTFDHNPIESIEEDAFAFCNQLFSLSLSYCQLKAIHNRMFTGLRSIHSVYLDHNLIDSFQIKTDDDDLIEIKGANMSIREMEMVLEHLFRGNTSMQYLILKGNQFTKLDLKVFCNLGSLHLDLEANKIDELNERAIEGMFGNYYVDLNLTKNQLAYVSRGSFPNRVCLNLDLRENPMREFGVDLSEPIEISESSFGNAMVEAMFNSSTKSSFVDREGISFVSIGDRKFLVSSSQPQVIERLFADEEDEETESPVKTVVLNNCSPKSIKELDICSTRFPNLEKLDLRWNTLNGMETNWFQNMANLQNLYLKGNQIESLDDANLFTNCPNLTYLDLSNNRLRTLNRRLFHGLYMLKYLYLSDNPELSSLDDGLFRSQFRLTTLDLSGNNIKRLNLPRLFKSCRYLTDLDLSNNQLDNRTFSPENMASLVNLKYLTLNHNQLENIEFARDMFKLEKLKLKSNKIESIEKDGYNLLGRLRSLSCLDLSGNRIRWLNKDMLGQLQNQVNKLLI